MTRRSVQLLLVFVLGFSLVGVSIAIASDKKPGKSGDAELKANLNGPTEIPFNNSSGTGRFTATMTDTKITFTLTYQNVTGNPLFAHIHVGQNFANGGVSIFLCGGGGKANCPAATSGTVTGELVAADVQGPTAQNFPVGNLQAVLQAIRLGQTYVNIHTPNSPLGEIRGQIKGGHKDHDEDGDDD
jgi:CHRD domain-containing protein